jgi:hypothetical protein
MGWGCWVFLRWDCRKKKKKRVELGNLGYIREFGKSGEG